MLKKHINKYLFKYNFSLVLAICIMLFIMSFLFFSIMLMNNSYSQQLKKLQVSNLEDFQFSPTISDSDNSSIDEQVNNLEETYQLLTEKQAYKYYDEDGIYYKIIRKSDYINEHILVQGKTATSLSDVVVDVKTADRLHLEVGDILSFSGENYNITGIAIFPSQLSPNMSNSQYQMYDSEHSTLLSFSNETYDVLPYEEQVIYSAIWKDDIKKVDSSQFSYLLMAKDNQELNALHTKLRMNQMIAGTSTGVLVTIVFIMIFMLIYIMIKDNESVFGILKSIGYANKQFVFAFIPFLFIFVLPIFFGFLISFTLKHKLFMFMNADLIIHYVDAKHSWLIFIFSCLAFILPVILLAIFTLLYLLRKSPIKMIQNDRSSNMGRVKQFILNRFNIVKGIFKLQLKFIFNYNFVLILTLFTGFALGVQTLLAFSLNEFPKKLMAGIEEQFVYQQHITFQNSVLRSEVTLKEGVKYKKVQSALIINNESNSINLHLLSYPKTNQILQFKSYKDETNINHLLNHGVIVSKWFANKYGLKKGDLLRIEENSQVSYDMPIAEVHIGLQGDELYTTFDYYKKITNNDISIVDGIYVNNIDQVSLPANAIYTTMDQQAVLQSAKQNVDFYRIISIFLFAIGIVISIVLLAIALYIVLQNGRKQMLLLKTIGYTNRQISFITIESYLSMLLVGIILSVPYLSMFSVILFDTISKESPFYLPIESSLLNIFIVLAITVVFFYVVAVLYIRKISKLKNFIVLINE